ncbi:MAG: right-handed parallel beta-helix repeat-containing protein [Bacteroidota bacterium]
MFALLGVAALVIGFFVVRNNVHFTDPDRYFCPAEKIADDGLHFKTDNGTFSGAKSQSQEHVFEGHHASKVWAEQDTGMAFQLTEVQGGEHYRISVFRFHPKDKGQLVVTGDWGFQGISTRPSLSHLRDFRKLMVLVRVPENVSNGTLRAFCVNKDARPAYFDNLLIERLPTAPANDLFDQAELPSEKRTELDHPAAHIRDYPACRAEFAEAHFFHALLRQENLPANQYSLLHELDGKTTVRVEHPSGPTPLTWRALLKDTPEPQLDRAAFGRFLALVELFRAYHLLTPEVLHFRPDDQAGHRPQIIGTFTRDLDLWISHRNIRSWYQDAPEMPSRYVNAIFEPLWKDAEFRTAYLQTLRKFSDIPEYHDLIAQFADAFALFEAACSGKAVNLFELIWNARRMAVGYAPFPNTSLRAYQPADSGYCDVASFHLFPLEVVGFGKGKGGMNAALAEAVVLPPLGRSDAPDWVRIAVPKGQDHAYCRVPGDAELYAVPVLPHRKPEAQAHGQFRLQLPDAVRRQGDTLVLEGEITLRETMRVPAGFQLYIAPGTKMRMIEGAVLLSRSPIFAPGTAEKPIHISSPDSSGTLAFFQIDTPSQLSHVDFQGLNTLLWPDWTLTGGVSFYESEVHINHCTFRENVCEDGLNIIRSDFTLKNSTIAHTFSDGLDLDFCRGNIEDCQFVNTGNDAMDFSGSQVTVKRTEVHKAGDKGISVGEASQATVVGAVLEDCVLGVAAKDLSLLKIESVSFLKVHTAFAAYQKKPEYGPAKILVDAYDMKEVGQLHLLQNGSELILEGRTIRGRR